MQSESKPQPNELKPQYNFSLDTLNLLVQSLVQEGRVSEDELFRYVRQNPSAEFRRVTDLIHRLFCRKPHGATDLDTNCAYDLEEALPDCWSQPFHQEMLQHTTNLLAELHLASETELLTELNSARPLLETIAQYETRKPAALRLVMRIKGWIQDSQD